MKRSRVVVPWREGLHLRAAVKLVRTAKSFRSSISLKCGEQAADLRSIMSILSLCATMGTCLDVEAMGDDEHEATHAVEHVFAIHNAGDAPDSAMR